MWFRFKDDNEVTHVVQGTFEECCKQEDEILGTSESNLRHPKPGDGLIMTNDEWREHMTKAMKKLVE